jgi:peptide/nickel transport system permease protein
MALPLKVTGSRRRGIPIAKRARRNLGATIGVSIVAGFLLLALLAPWIAPSNPLALDLSHTYSPPSATHPFGTDGVGRDVLSRVIAGSRLSVEIIIWVLVLAAGIGTVVGLLAGYWGGLVDEVFMRITDVFFAFPSFLLAMAVTAALGRSLQNAMISVAVAFWPAYARLVRGLVLGLKQSAFVEAARCIGARNGRIMLRHILPNCFSLLLVQVSLNAGTALLTTAGLSFVGLGASPPSPEWGVMVADGRTFITTSWWMSIFPGLAIAVVVAGFMYLGDGLRDLLDPTLRHLVG